MNNCDPSLVKLKANFLGPKAENSGWLERNINSIFSKWCDWRRNRFPQDENSISENDKSLSEFKKFQQYIYDCQNELSFRFEKEIPKYSPRYMGHMVSEISLPALFGHLIALIHNPNNSSFSASKIGLTIEQEAINDLGHMIGFTSQATGHFTSGGTVANIEGLWRARYRLDHNLSFGAFLANERDQNISFFNSAQMGLNEFEELKDKYNVSDENFKKYSFVINGPYQTYEIYKDIFKVNYRGPIVLVPCHKHYSWKKAISLLGFGDDSLWSIELDETGHISMNHLKLQIEIARKEKRPILCVVSVAGTTEIGMVDPIDKVQDLLDKYKSEGIHIWHHVDAAYGGMYISILRGGQGTMTNSLSPKVMDALSSISRVESVTLDPHKLAMVPYACGAIVVKDESHYHISKFKAPYLKESSENLGKWNSTLEGSRAATGACATWMISKSLGLDQEGIGNVLSLGIQGKNQLENLFKARIPSVQLISNSDTNIVCFNLAEEGDSISQANLKTQSLFDYIYNSEYYSVSQTTLTNDNYGVFLNDHISKWNGVNDEEGLLLIRMVIMNPFLVSKENKIDYLDEFITLVESSLAVN